MSSDGSAYEDPSLQSPSEQQHLQHESSGDMRGEEEEEPRGRQGRIRRLRAAARARLRVSWDETALVELNLEMMKIRAARGHSSFYVHRKNDAKAEKDKIKAEKDKIEAEKLRAEVGVSKSDIVEALSNSAQGPKKLILEDSDFHLGSGAAATSSGGLRAEPSSAPSIHSVSVAPEDSLPPVRKLTHRRQRTTYLSVDALEDSTFQVEPDAGATSACGLHAELEPAAPCIEAVFVATEESIPPVEKFSHRRQRTTYIHAN